MLYAQNIHIECLPRLWLRLNPLYTANLYKMFSLCYVYYANHIMYSHIYKSHVIRAPTEWRKCVLLGIWPFSLYISRKIDNQNLCSLGLPLKAEIIYVYGAVGIFIQRSMSRTEKKNVIRFAYNAASTHSSQPYKQSHPPVGCAVSVSLVMALQAEHEKPHRKNNLLRRTSHDL